MRRIQIECLGEKDENHHSLGHAAAVPPTLLLLRAPIRDMTKNRPEGESGPEWLAAGHGNERFKECTGEDASMSCPCPLDSPGVHVKTVIPSGPLASCISLPESVIYPERVLGSPVWGKAEGPGSSHPLRESQAMRGIDSGADNDPSFLTFGWRNSELCFPLFLRGIPTRLSPSYPQTKTLFNATYMVSSFSCLTFPFLLSISWDHLADELLTLKSLTQVYFRGSSG